MRFQDDPGPGRQTLHNHLAGGDICKLEFPLVSRAPQAAVEQVQRPAHVCGGETGSVWLPGQGRDGVVVFDKLERRLVPRGSSHTPIEYVHAVEAADNEAGAGWVEFGCGKVGLVLVLAIVKLRNEKGAGGVTCCAILPFLE